MRKFILIIFLLIFNSCVFDKTNSNDLIFPKDSTENYFNFRESLSLETNENEISKFENEWYSKMLFALKEPILKDYRGKKEIYRFTWLRTFHHPVSIIIIKENDKISITTKVSDGAGGYEPGMIFYNKTDKLSVKDYEILQNKINTSEFWKMKTELEIIGNDGAQWIIEGVKNNNYKLVVRWTPKISEEFKNFREIGEFLISKSNLPKEELNDIY
jgi:hypothetical protein